MQPCHNFQLPLRRFWRLHCQGFRWHHLLWGLFWHQFQLGQVCQRGFCRRCHRGRRRGCRGRRRGFRRRWGRGRFRLCFRHLWFFLLRGFRLQFFLRGHRFGRHRFRRLFGRRCGRQRCRRGCHCRFWVRGRRRRCWVHRRSLFPRR